MLAMSCHMVLILMVNSGSDNGLLPDSINILPEPMLTNGHLVPQKQRFRNSWNKLPKIFLLQNISHLFKPHKRIVLFISLVYMCQKI